MKYRGSCHCGTIAFDVEGEIDGVMSCNCSMCQRKGSLLWFVPRASLQLSTPQEASRVYRFNKHRLEHHFCPTCGIHPYAEGKDPKGNDTAAINIRCLEGIDLAAIPSRTSTVGPSDASAPPEAKAHLVTNAMGTPRPPLR